MISVIILAIIQGISEFLPISSSAHLIIFRDLFGIGSNVVSGDLEIIFDISLHFGTLLAIVIYFFKDLFNILIEGITKGTKTKSGSLLYKIIVATIPAAIIGFLFEDIIEEFFRGNFYVIGFGLIFMGIILYIFDKSSKQDKKFDEISFKDAFLIGCGQIFALIPGFSRSGTTISVARKLKYDRESSAKFSFFLSVPVIMGAALLNLIKDDNITLITSNLNVFIIGILVSFMVGLLTINFFLKYINNHNYKIFMIYRVILGIIVIVLALFR